MSKERPKKPNQREKKKKSRRYGENSEATRKAQFWWTCLVALGLLGSAFHNVYTPQTHYSAAAQSPDALELLTTGDQVYNDRSLLEKRDRSVSSIGSLKRFDESGSRRKAKEHFHPDIELDVSE